MNQMSRVVSALSAVMLASALHAQSTTGMPSNQYIVTMSFNDVVLHTAEAQKALSSLQSKFAPREGRVRGLNEEVEALRRQVENAGSQASETEKTTRAETVSRKERELQREADGFKADFQAESQEVFERVAQKVFAFVQTYAKQRGYTAVIERGTDASPVVWYAASDIDITEQVIKAYDAQAGAAVLPPVSSPTGAGGAKAPQSLPKSPSPRP